MVKYYKVLAHITFQILMALKLLMNLKASLTFKLTSLTFTPIALNFKLKKLPLGIQLLQNLLNDMNILQNLPNDKKSLQNYQMEQQHFSLSR